MLYFLDGFPILSSNPVITFTYEIEDVPLCANKYLVIQCDVTHDEQAIYLDIYWYIDNRLVKQNVKVEAIHYDDLPANLHENELVDRAPTALKPLDTEVLELCKL